MDLYQEKAKRFGLENNLRYLGALPRHELMRVVKEADVGLALFPMQTDNVNLNHLTGASNKAFDYLAGGLALLVSARPDWEEMFVQPGYGLSCDPNDANSIAAQLRWFLEHPVETREMGECGRQRILTEWNYEKQFSPVLRRLNRSAQT
jgi:glycosyltransferase involved in cell wall biosynthesis